MTGCLRVVQVVCTGAFAGVERYVTTLAAGLADRGCELVVLGGGPPERMRASLVESGVQWMGAGSVVDALVNLLRRRHVDLIHAHLTAGELAAVVGSAALRAPVVTTRHVAKRRGSSTPARFVGRLLTRQITMEVAISRYVARAVEGVSTVIYPGTPLRADASPADAREPVVLVAQRLQPEKRTDLAIETWRQSGLAAEGWRLWLAGDGEHLCQLKELAAGLGVTTSCEFLGDRDDVESLQERAAIVLAPRPDEPLGLSVLEAMAAGTPVVAAAGGGHLESVGECPGAVLYPPFDTRLAGRLLRELAFDPGRRTRYGRALQATQRRVFSIDRQVTDTFDVYRTAMRGRLEFLGPSRMQ